MSSLEAKVPCGQPSRPREHLSGLAGIVVDGLLAHDDEVGRFLGDDRREQLGDGERLRRLLGPDMDAAVSAHRQRRADGLLAWLRPHRHGDDLLRRAGLDKAQRLLDGDLVERVHRHLHVGELHPRLVRLDADLDVGIDHALHRDEHLHGPAAPLDPGGTSHAGPAPAAPWVGRRQTRWAPRPCQTNGAGVPHGARVSPICQNWASRRVAWAKVRATSGKRASVSRARANRSRWSLDSRARRWKSAPPYSSIQRR